jgi:hypothetical protein
MSVRERKPRTKCDLCNGKSFVNLAEHITKMHTTFHFYPGQDTFDYMGVRWIFAGDNGSDDDVTRIVYAHPTLKRREGFLPELCVAYNFNKRVIESIYSTTPRSRKIHMTKNVIVH